MLHLKEEYSSVCEYSCIMFSVALESEKVTPDDVIAVSLGNWALTLNVQFNKVCLRVLNQRGSKENG